MKSSGAFLLLSFIVWGVSVVQAEVTVKVVEPVEGGYIEPCSDVLVKAEITTTADEVIKYVYLYYNDKTFRRLRSQPWEYEWKSVKSGVYYLSAKVVLEDDQEIFSDSIKVKCGNVSGAERIINGGFDCGTITPWRASISSIADAQFVVYDDGYFDDASYLAVEIANGGGAERWSIQMLQVCPLDSGHTYEISFMADALEKKSIYVGMQLAVDPWSSRFSADVEIDGANLYGPFEFMSEVTDPLNDMVFHFGPDDIPVFLDNVQVIDKSATAVTSRNMDFDGRISEYQLLQAYPNPFNMNTTIRYSLSNSANVSLDIFNMVGQKVRVLESTEKSAGQHSVTWDGLDDRGSILPSGLFIYRLQIQNGAMPTVLSRKVLLLK